VYVYQEEKGLVTCVSDARHLFDVDDQVTFSEVKGMTQLNGLTPHPVTAVHGIQVNSSQVVFINNKHKKNARHDTSYSFSVPMSDNC